MQARAKYLTGCNAPTSDAKLALAVIFAVARYYQMQPGEVRHGQANQRPAARRAAMLILHSLGLTYARIAEQLDCHERTVLEGVGWAESRRRKYPRGMVAMVCAQVEKELMP